MTIADELVAFGAVGSLVVALVAVYVAWSAREAAITANGIASDARDAEKRQAAIADDALTATRRQTELAAVPNLLLSSLDIDAANARHPQRFTANIENAGPTVAYGVILSAAVATERSLDAIDESTRGWSRRHPGLSVGHRVPRLGAVMPTLYGEWLAIRVQCYSPLGASVTQDYLWSRTAFKLRLHKVTIRPEHGGPLTFALELGLERLEEDEPDEPSPQFVPLE